MLSSSSKRPILRSRDSKNMAARAAQNAALKGMKNQATRVETRTAKRLPSMVFLWLKGFLKDPK